MTVQRIHMEGFPNRNMSGCQTFECLHQKLCVSRSFYGLILQKFFSGKSNIMYSRGISFKNLRIVGWALGVSHLLVHKMHVGKFCINVMMHVVQNPCGKWRFKSAKPFHLLISTMLSTASMLHFCNHITIQNLLLRF